MIRMDERNLRNVVIIGIDALRADHLGCYGYQKPTSHNIDMLAGSGVVFDACYSCINTTDPAFTTLLSGMYPVSHGIRKHAEGLKPWVYNFNKHPFVLIQEVLQKSGYSTFGLDWLGRWHKRGFSYYLGTKYKRTPTATNMVNEAIQLLETTTGPYFLFIHFWDAHTPYRAPEHIYANFEPDGEGTPLAKLFSGISNPKWKRYLMRAGGDATTAEEMVAKYDAAIAYVDQEIGRLVTYMQERGDFDDTLLVITSDHGESLTEHGIYFDHHGLYDATTHVPLIFVNGPGKGIRTAPFVQHVDIVPTLFELLGVGMPGKVHLDGTSLVPFMEGRGGAGRPSIISEEQHTQRRVAIRTREWKYILAPSRWRMACRNCGHTHGMPEELYDLSSDPGELSNIVAKRPEIARGLRRELESTLRGRRNRVLHRQIKQATGKIFGIVKPRRSD